jgi:hypothetical protein
VFCWVFVVRTTNTPRRNVSAWFIVAFALASVYTIVLGFVTRKKYFAKSAAVLLVDPLKAVGFWRMANIMGFTCAMNMTIFGVVLRILGGSWTVFWIFLLVSLAFFVLWRPRPLGANGALTA